MRALAMTALIAVSIGMVGGSAAQAEDSARYHHTHLNVVDPDKTVDFYKRMFSGVPINFRGVQKAVFTDRSYILLNKVDEPAPWKMTSGLYHIGWGGVDGPSDFAWRDREGVEWETPLSELGTNHFMYAYGPDKEVVEVWTGFKHHRFGHVHLFADNVNDTKNWYMKHLGLAGSPDTPKPPKAPDDFVNDGGFALFRYMWTGQVMTDNEVTINVFSKPSEDTINWWAYEGLGELVATDGRVIDHIAFSYEDIDPVYERMQKDGVEIVKPLAYDESLKMRSFFVRGPDKVLIEIVEAKPIPESSWSE